MRHGFNVSKKALRQSLEASLLNGFSLGLYKQGVEETNPKPLWRKRLLPDQRIGTCNLFVSGNENEV